MPRDTALLVLPPSSAAASGPRPKSGREGVAAGMGACCSGLMAGLAPPSSAAAPDASEEWKCRTSCRSPAAAHACCCWRAGAAAAPPAAAARRRPAPSAAGPADVLAALHRLKVARQRAARERAEAMASVAELDPKRDRLARGCNAMRADADAYALAARAQGEQQAAGRWVVRLQGKESVPSAIGECRELRWSVRKRALCSLSRPPARRQCSQCKSQAPASHEPCTAPPYFLKQIPIEQRRQQRTRRCCRLNAVCSGKREQPARMVTTEAVIGHQQPAAMSEQQLLKDPAAVAGPPPTSPVASDGLGNLFRRQQR